MNMQHILLILLTLGACTQQVETVKTAQVDLDPQQVLDADKTISFPFEGGFSKGMMQVIEEGRCHISADFGSFASGISHAHLDATLKILSQSQAVNHIYIQPWGREGEQSVCAEIPDTSNRKDVMAELEAMMESLGTPTHSSVTLRFGDQKPN
jgi:hypothetical protein